MPFVQSIHFPWQKIVVGSPGILRIYCAWIPKIWSPGFIMHLPNMIKKYWTRLSNMTYPFLLAMIAVRKKMVQQLWVSVKLPQILEKRISPWNGKTGLPNLYWVDHGASRWYGKRQKTASIWRNRSALFWGTTPSLLISQWSLSLCCSETLQV